MDNLQMSLCHSTSMNHIRLLCCALPHTVWPHNQAVQWEMLIKSRCLCMHIEPLSHSFCLSLSRTLIHTVHALTHICDNVQCYIFPFSSIFCISLVQPGGVFYQAASFSRVSLDPVLLLKPRYLILYHSFWNFI